MKTATIVKYLSRLSPGQMESVAVGLAWYDAAQAERLKNTIGVAQQEMDALEDQERQYEMMSKEEAYE